MITGSVARRYARALFELALEADRTDKIERDLEGFVEGIHQVPEVWRSLTNPGFSRGERREVLDKMLPHFSLEKTTSNFLRLLIDKGRVDHLDAISREYRALNDIHQRRVRAKVRSAMALEDAELTRLKNLLQQVTGRTVLLEHRVDDNLIGGMVTEVGGLVFDGSLRTQLRRIRERLVLENA
jgi:F-type H+-transporting ATPase subunit delta